MATPRKKNPQKRGRPSTYDPAIIPKLLALAKEGNSLVQCSAKLDIPRTTMVKWGDKHPDFATALIRAKELEQAWWEEKGKAGMEDRNFNANVYRIHMQARFRDEYTERKEVSGQVVVLQKADADL